MQKQLWAKNTSTYEKILDFTTGQDHELDLHLAKYDIQGSLAHITMLESINLLTKQEFNLLRNELLSIYENVLNGEFVLEDGVEDVHSQIEFMLTRKLGDVGKKIHSGRSRNDQVLVDLKLFVRDGIEKLADETEKLFLLLQSLSEKYKDFLLPGYTHFQVAMPSSFGLWFGAYAESLADDMQMLLAAYKLANRNPLGSAAGYGSSFGLNRTLTTQLLGFEGLNYNVCYAQMTRVKCDYATLSALASVAHTLNKLATDVVLYVSQNFNFISFPSEVMEGSSIMPHKKNPDVFEMIRAKTNQIKGWVHEVNMLISNMPSGYHRDWQILKEYTIPSFDKLIACIQMSHMMLDKVQVQQNILADEKYKYIFSVEEVNRLVLEGMPFRDAYKKVGEEIENGRFTPNYDIKHTHEGSIGDVGTKYIHDYFCHTKAQFGFDKKNKAIKALLTK